MARSTAERIRTGACSFFEQESYPSVVLQRGDDGFAGIAQIGNDQGIVHVLG